MSPYDSTGQTLESHTKSSYEYDDSGIRVAQTVQVDVNNDGDFDDAGVDTTERTDYHVDHRNPTGYAQVLEEMQGGAVVKSYAIGHDVFLEAIAANQIRHLLKDGHGSTRQLVDATGAVITSPTAQVFAYDAYGNPHGFTLANALTTHLYSGEQTDQLTGLQYLRARYYSPATGGLNRLDPFAGNLSDPQSLHKYLYTHGDPVNGVDPSGQILELLLAGGQYAKLQAQRAMAGLSALRGAYGLQRLVGIYQTAVASYAQVGFRVAEFLVKAGPTIRRVTTLSGVVFVTSTLWLACEEFGFVPRTGYTEFVVGASSTIFSR